MTKDEGRMTNLTSQQREIVRQSLLRYCNASGKFGMGLGLLLASIRAEGFRGMTADELERELDYLVEKGLLAESNKEVSPELKAWKISAAGRDYLAREGYE